MTENRYPTEALNDDHEDDGTMPENVEELRQNVVGRKIVHAEQTVREMPIYEGYKYARKENVLVLTLDDGREVILKDTDDCCAYTELQEFWRDPSSVDHAILGVGTTDGYETWHIYADFGDVMRFKVGWSCGNPFYYGYGFDITMQDATVVGEVVK